MPELKSGTLLPSAKESAALAKAAKADPDAVPYSEADWRKAKATVRVGRPKLESPKVFTGIRLDADVVDTFKATGKGWQTKINAALREWLKTHSLT